MTRNVTDRECRLVSLTTADGRTLHGALHDHPDPAAAVLYIHGKGGNFYSGPGRFIPRLAASCPVRHLSLNLRSHDLGYTRDDAHYEDFERGSTPVDGGCWEDLSTGTEDIRTGVEFLRTLGAPSVLLVGHSSGGWYSARYCAQDPSVAGQALLSTVLDVKRSLRFWFPHDEDLDRACADALRMVERGEGHLLMPLSRWYYAISARSLLARVAQPSESLSIAMQTSQAPLLMVWGSEETRDVAWHQHFDDVPMRNKYYVRIPGAGHDFLGKEDAVTQAVMDFVSRVTDGEVPSPAPHVLEI